MSLADALAIKLPSKRFERISAGTAFVVIDTRTGRHMSTLTGYVDAGRIQDRLNTAAYGGRAQLNMALGASADWNSTGVIL